MWKDLYDIVFWELPSVQCSGLLASTAGGTGLIPGWGTKILQATKHGQKKKKDIVKRKRKAGQEQYINMVAYMLKK